MRDLVSDTRWVAFFIWCTMDEFVDPLLIFDSTGEPTVSLRNLLKGGSAFLVGGGPSSNALDLTRLKQRGLFSMAINNMAGKFWSNAFVCADPPSKFHTGIWLDPTMMKFVPKPKLDGGRAKLREKIGDEFHELKIGDKPVLTRDCPNVWGFGRRAWLMPDDTFFTESEAAWGNHRAGVTRTGLQKTVNTTFLALRLLYYLGARTIFLVGVDWSMSASRAVDQNYAFPQGREPGSVNTNNEQYRISGEWLQTMQDNGTFKKYGLNIYNCFEFSHLRAFGHVPFDSAIQYALKRYPKEPFDLKFWYEKK